MTRIKIDLDLTDDLAQAVDSLSLWNLKDILHMVEKDTKQLQEMEDRPEYINEDLEYNLQVIDALKVIIKYIGG